MSETEEKKNKQETIRITKEFLAIGR